MLDFGGVCTPSHAEFLAAARDGRSLAELRDRCLPTVRTIRALGIAVVLLSNEIDRTASANAPLLAEVDHILACTDNGILKPDRRAFQRALLVSGVTAERALVIDDDEDNVRSARSIDATALLFDCADPDTGWLQIAAQVGLDPKSIGRGP